jgi:hypothetical protein
VVPARGPMFGAASRAGMGFAAPPVLSEKELYEHSERWTGRLKIDQAIFSRTPFAVQPRISQCPAEGAWLFLPQF